MKSYIKDSSWSFAELDRAQTSYLTHDYHRYPAKFIPQLACRLIEENSQPGDLIYDPFTGSGTTLVEAIINGRSAYGADINPIAVLISRAKTTPIEPNYLECKVSSVLAQIKMRLLNENEHTQFIFDKFCTMTPDHNRIDYWFPKKQKHDLAIILSEISRVENQHIRSFLLCGFSNILKGCSRWMMKSIKPTKDENKIIAEVFKSFITQIYRMLRKNEEFWNIVGKKRAECLVHYCDARKISIRNNSVKLLITSPPYVTSYEYADLHQLTAIWLGYLTKLHEFRSKFIGSVKKSDCQVDLVSDLGIMIVNNLKSINTRQAKSVERYFFDMQQCFFEMYRVLENDGRVCIVIGNTELRKVRIQNTEVFIQIMEKAGFTVNKIIERSILNRILPLTRDKTTGRFTAKNTADRLAYPTEYIIIMDKI